MFVYTEAEMHILHIIQLILLFPFVCEAVGEVEWKREPELPHLTLLSTVTVSVAANHSLFSALFSYWSFEPLSHKLHNHERSYFMMICKLLMFPFNITIWKINSIFFSKIATGYDRLPLWLYIHIAKTFYEYTHMNHDDARPPFSFCLRHTA